MALSPILRRNGFLRQYLAGSTLAEIGAEHGVTGPRVRQLVVKAANELDLAMAGRPTGTPEDVFHETESAYGIEFEWTRQPAARRYAAYSFDGGVCAARPTAPLKTQAKTP